MPYIQQVLQQESYYPKLLLISDDVADPPILIIVNAGALGDFNFSRTPFSYFVRLIWFWGKSSDLWKVKKWIKSNI